MRRYIPAASVTATTVLTMTCQEVVPTATDPDLIPVAPVTVEVRLPFSAFGRDPQVFGGFGSTSQLNTALVAADFEGTLDARALARFASYPDRTSVSDSAGRVVTDSMLTYVGGRIVAVIDTSTAVFGGPVELVAGSLRERWDPTTATWALAVDTVADMTPWSVEGAGPVAPVDSAVWDPELGDSVVFAVDSATVADWRDTTNLARGLRLSGKGGGARLEMRPLILRLDTRPSVKPDTVIEVSVGTEVVTFVYDPPPPPPTGEFRVGGAPAWRSTFRMELPDTLDGPPQLCALLGCPFFLTEESVNFAALVLESAATLPAFAPDDTLALDARPVLSEEQLPKAPVGSSLVRFPGVSLPPELFADSVGGTVNVPVTSFVQDVIRGETLTGAPAPKSLSLLSSFEPLSLEYASFTGPGAEGEPVLRLLLTTRIGVPLR